MDLKTSMLSGVTMLPFTYAFGTWTPLLTVLCVMIALDIITGITKGFYKKELRSRNMSQGMIRKAMIFIVIILANMIDITVFGGVSVCRMAVVTFYIAYEGLSILENLGQMDVPLPDFIKSHLELLRDKSNEKGKNK